MSILSSVLLAFIASLDSLIIGLAYGVKKIKISIAINIFIAIIVTLGTFLSMYLGLLFCKIINKEIPSLLGSILLIAISIYMIIDYLLKKRKETASFNSSRDVIDCLDYDDIIKNDKTADSDGSGAIELREGIGLAIALTLNNFALGFGASISGISIPITTFFTFLFSIFMVIIGLRIGSNVFSKVFGKAAPLFSSFIIAIMGIYQIIVLYI